MNLSESISNLRPKGKAPNSARILNAWITQAERQLESDGEHLGWLVASTVVTAVLQCATDNQDRPYFLLKGGTLLQHHLPEPMSGILPQSLLGTAQKASSHLTE